MVNNHRDSDEGERVNLGEDRVNSGDPDLEFLLNLVSNLRSCRAHKLFPNHGDINYGLRRASVAIVLRYNFQASSDGGKGERGIEEEEGEEEEFEKLHEANLEKLGFKSFQKRKEPDWRLRELLQEVRRYKPRLEILFMQRVTRDTDRWSGHVSFPGGKRDLPQDLTDFDTATRECQEEVGLDLKSLDKFHFLGELDDRLVKSRFGQKDLMILSPQVFVQVTKLTPPLNLQVTEVAKAGWVPLHHLLTFHPSTTTNPNPNPHQTSSPVKLKYTMDVAKTLLPPRHSLLFGPLTKFLRLLLRWFCGNMHFTALPLPPPFTTPTLLWGLTLGMVSDLVDLGHTPREVHHLTPLNYPLPSFDLWPINFLVRKFCPPDYLRKPVTSRPSSPWELYFQLIRTALPLTLLTKLILLYTFTRYLLSHRGHFLSTLLYLLSLRRSP